MRPLEGVTVVALEHVIAGPFCTRQLADLGARIIKIERPGVGDTRSKESIMIDLKQDETRRIVHQLLERADVLVQNLAPGDLWITRSCARAEDGWTSIRRSERSRRCCHPVYRKASSRAWIRSPASDSIPIAYSKSWDTMRGRSQSCTPSV